jgi:hypothetical protein
MAPDVEEARAPHIPAGKRKLHARINVAIRRNVAGSVSCTARESFEILFSFRRWRAEFLHIPHQALIAEHLVEGRLAGIEAGTH